jgi:hypothetical protein
VNLRRAGLTHKTRCQTNPPKANEVSDGDVTDTDCPGRILGDARADNLDKVAGPSFYAPPARRATRVDPMIALRSD